HSFTIMDFKRATELFADENFDGPPEQVYEPKPGESVVPPENLGGSQVGESAGADEDPDDDPNTSPPPSQGHVGVDHLGGGETPRKYVVAGVSVCVASERIQYYDGEGKLVTESLKDYTTKRVKASYNTLNQFLQEWSDADKKAAIIRGLEEEGVVFQALADEVGKDIGPFDLICHIVFGQPALTRKQRAAKVRKNKDYFAKYGKQARAVLDALLDKYSDGGLDDIENLAALKVQPISELGSMMEIVGEFGGKDAYEQAVHELASAIYSP
ncbi:MAG: type I restriction-modification enzyme R subunit C-terminal domain-containing protein, partial [Nannocystaceae bacterium]